MTEKMMNELELEAAALGITFSSMRRLPGDKWQACLSSEKNRASGKGGTMAEAYRNTINKYRAQEAELLERKKLKGDS